MGKETRQKQIMEILRNKGRIEVEEVCQMFDISNMTVRRDLEDLEQAGLLIRTYGGAYIAENDVLAENPFYFRLRRNMADKIKVAVAATASVLEGQKIFIGSGTTTHYFAQKMDNSRHLIVVTDAINIASELITRPNISVIQLGGVLRSNTSSITGAFAESMIRQLSFNTAYIGLTGIGKDGRLFVGSIAQMSIYQSVFESSERIIILADASKLASNDFVCIGKLSEKFLMITNKEAPESLLNSLRDSGAKVMAV